jgi:hypothetical protein
MRKLLLAMVFIVFVKASMFENRPDALRCGGDNGCCEGAIYVAHMVFQTQKPHTIFKSIRGQIFPSL